MSIRIKGIVLDILMWALIATIDLGSGEYANAADNVLTFFVGVMFVIYMTVIFRFNEAVKKMQEQPHSGTGHRLYSNITSLAKIAAFASFGFFWLASAYTFMFLVALGIRRENDKRVAAE